MIFGRVGYVCRWCGEGLGVASFSWLDMIKGLLF